MYGGIDGRWILGIRRVEQPKVGIEVIMSGPCTGLTVVFFVMAGSANCL